MKKYFFSLATIIFFLACNNASKKEVRTSNSPSDSSIQKAGPQVNFAAITDSSKLMVLKKDGKTITYPAYKQLFIAEATFTQPSFTQQDIDGDGSKEIVVASYTGGAHCCDVTTILTRTADNEMKEVFDFTGGTYISNDTLTLSFFEALGYFHTCYACAVEYPGNLDAAVRLRFSKGIFSYLPSVEKDNGVIIESLKFLQTKGIPDKDSDGADGFDDGTRKAYAFNLVAYYYNNARDLAKTKQLFDQYYTHKDKETIWKDLSRYIAGFDEDIKKAAFVQ